MGLCVGIADHYGWAVAVTAKGPAVVDRRRIELVEPGVPPAPVHHGIEDLDDAAAVALIADVRASAVRATTASLAELAAGAPEPITAISLRSWPLDFPDDIATLRRSPYEARADPVMYRQVLAEVAHARGWALHVYEAKAVEGQALALLGEATDDLLRRPRQELGAPWTKDHRVAFAAAITAG